MSVLSNIKQNCVQWLKKGIKHNYVELNHLTFTCSKSIKERLEKGVKYVQS